MRIKSSTETVFQIIRQHGPLYNSEIMLHVDFVKSTVSLAVAELLRMGIIEEEPSVQKRKRVRLAEDYGSVIGVYMGLTSIHIALCDLKANILDSVDYPLNLDKKTPEEIVTLIISSIENFNTNPPLGIGIGVPGPVNFTEKVCISPPEMPGWDNYPICSILQERFKCSVILDNDVNVLALGERDKGIGENVPNFLYVKVGTGIGSGLVIDGELYRGSMGAAGDIGHIAIDGNDTPCPCGNKGCLEIVAASRGLIREALRQKSASKFLSTHRDEEITAAIVGSGMYKGDEICTQIIIQSGYAVGSVLAKLVNFFNPALIVIGGGVSQSGQKFISSIQEVLYRRSTALATAQLIVRRSQLLDQGGTMGAAILVIDHILQNIGNNPILKSNITTES